MIHHNHDFMKRLFLLVFIILPGMLCAQQIADTAYHPVIPNPEYPVGKGPVVYIDEGHFNFHTINGRYSAFANLLERDGYRVSGNKGVFTENRLSEGKILVISNALNEANVRNWFLPTPSAFTKEEIEAVRKWVAEGGSLFLIADHMPFAGAATDLAAAFGFTFTNGFALDTLSGGPAFFNLQDGTLAESILTRGRNQDESVKQIASFTGQAFRIPPDASPVLIFNEKYINRMPDTAWVFTNKTPQYNVKGYSQGAYKKYGKGKVVAFGEAAMFSAQLASAEKRKMGMNSDQAPENYKLLLNIIHWLDGKLE